MIRSTAISFKEDLILFNNVCSLLGSNPLVGSSRIRILENRINALCDPDFGGDDERILAAVDRYNPYEPHGLTLLTLDNNSGNRLSMNTISKSISTNQFDVSEIYEIPWWQFIFTMIDHLN